MLREGINGFCMALADSVPGVSGGTVAFIMGFYDRFIGSIHNLAFYLWLVKEARKHIIAGDFSTWKNTMVRQLNNRL